MNRSYAEVYALLYLTRRCEMSITEFFCSYGVPASAIQSGMHLTVYYAQRKLPGLQDRQSSRLIAIEADSKETRFMVLAPGGENPRSELDPGRKSVGIRLTKRNVAIREIQFLRRQMISLETPQVVGSRNPSTEWTSCFGARHYQPHVKFLRSGSGIDRDLTLLGQEFRSHFSTIEFGKFSIFARS